MLAGVVQLGASIGSVFSLIPLAAIIAHYGWRDSMSIAALVMAVFALLIGLLVRDNPQGWGLPVSVHARQSEQNIVRENSLLVLAGNYQLWLVALCSIVCWVPVAAVGALWGVPYLMKIYQMTALMAGKVVSLFWLALALGCPFVGWYSNYISRRKTPFILCFALALVGAVLWIMAPRLPIWLTVVALMLLGFSAAVQPLSFGLLKDILPNRLFSSASGINNMAAIIGGGLAQLVIGYLLRLHWNGSMLHNVPVYSLSNYLVAFSIIPISALVGLLLSCLFIRETYCKNIDTME